MFFKKTVENEHDFSGVRTIRIDAAGLDLNLSLHNNGKTVTKLSGKSDQCNLVVTPNNSEGTVALFVKNEGSAQCTLDVGFPQSFSSEIAIFLTSGIVTSVGLSSDHRFQLSSGRVEINGKAIKSINGGIQAGSFQGKGLTGDTSIDVGAGEVLIEYEKVPLKGLVRAHVMAGNVEIRLPEHSGYRAIDYPANELIAEMSPQNDSEFVLDLLCQKGKSKIRKK